MKAPNYRIIEPESCSTCCELRYFGGSVFQCDKYEDQKIHDRYVKARVCDDFNEGN